MATEQEQFDDTIKRLQDRLNAGGAEASVEKQLGELPARPDDAPLPHDAEFLAEFSKRAPKASRPDTPAVKMWAAKRMRPGNAREGFSTGSPIVETRSPIPPEPADGAAGDEPAPVAKRSVIMPEDAGVSAPAPEESTLLAPDTSEGTDTLATFEVSPERQAEQDDYRRRHHEASLERFIPNQPYVADTVLETPRMLQREMGPPAPPPNPQMGPPREVMMPGEGQGDSPVGVPDKLLAEATKPTENASPVAVAQAQKATPAVSVADTGGGDEDPEEAVKRYAANRAKGMSEILRIGNRFAAGIAGKKPDFGTADWLDKMEAGDEAAVKARADRAQKLREYAAQRADKDRAFGLQEREVKVKEHPPVAKLGPGKTQAQIDAEHAARVGLLGAQKEKALRTGGDAEPLLSPDAIARAAKVYRDSGGVIMPSLGRGPRATETYAQIVNESEKIAGGADPLRNRADWGAKQQAIRQATYRKANIDSAIGTVQANVDILKEKVAALPDAMKTSFIPWNKAVTAANEYIYSNPAYQPYKNVLGTITNEYAFVMSLGQSAAMTDSMRAKAEGMIARGMSEGTMDETLKTIVQEMEGRQAETRGTLQALYNSIGSGAPVPNPERRQPVAGQSAPAKVKVTDKSGKSKMLDPVAAEKYRGVAGFTVE